LKEAVVALFDLRDQLATLRDTVNHHTRLLQRFCPELQPDACNLPTSQQGAQQGLHDRMAALEAQLDELLQRRSSSAPGSPQQPFAEQTPAAGRPEKPAAPTVDDPEPHGAPEAPTREPAPYTVRRQPDGRPMLAMLDELAAKRDRLPNAEECHAAGSWFVGHVGDRVVNEFFVLAPGGLRKCGIYDGDWLVLRIDALDRLHVIDRRRNMPALGGG